MSNQYCERHNCERSDTASTALWLLFNHFSPEDEEQAVGLEKADRIQPADLQKAPKAAGSSSWLSLTSLPQRPKAEKATGRGEGCGSKKEELRVGSLQWSVFPA